MFFNLTIVTIAAMASNDDSSGVQRKKRAWRKPREPVTPYSENAGEILTAKPIKLQRSAISRSTDATIQQDCVAGKNLDGPIIPPVKHHETSSESGRDVSTTRGVSSMMDASPLGIDGSIMEGVRKN